MELKSFEGFFQAFLFHLQSGWIGEEKWKKGDRREKVKLHHNGILDPGARAELCLLVQEDLNFYCLFFEAGAELCLFPRKISGQAVEKKLSFSDQFESELPSVTDNIQLCDAAKYWRPDI